MTKLKKSVVTLGLALMVSVAMMGIVFAETVYFHGDAVNWEHGRDWALFSYSKVQTHKYEHCATANGIWSGWKKEGTEASARCFIGFNRATAYWDCR